MNGKMDQDLFLDDQSLILNTDNGLVVIMGCAHSGMINTLHYITHKTGIDRFYAILGGTHLGFLNQDQLEESINLLKKMEIRRIGVSHCTGMKAAFRLHEEFPNQFFYGHVGSVIEI
jgi:7,8-dihydropterin-6-yl-methyl-4-(beta-D-ribofuranosyl)aminobenzene 5'-phosphate synthase